MRECVEFCIVGNLEKNILICGKPVCSNYRGFSQVYIAIFWLYDGGFLPHFDLNWIVTGKTRNNTTARLPCQLILLFHLNSDSRALNKSSCFNNLGFCKWQWRNSVVTHNTEWTELRLFVSSSSMRLSLDLVWSEALG